MANYKIENLSFSYNQCEEKALDGIDLEINDGDFVVIAGKSGCGKSTLLRLMKHLIAPAGKRDGKILYDGIDVNETSQEKLVGEIAFVFQNVDNQIITDTVEREMMFTPMCMGMDEKQAFVKVAESAAYFGIDNYFDSKTDTLSGGRKQILNLASAMVMQAKVLILDEPLSQLDPIAKAEFISHIERLNKENGVTVIMSEHSFDDIYRLADKICIMESGKVKIFSKTQDAAKQLLEMSMTDFLPQSAVFSSKLNCGDLAFTVRDAKRQLQNKEVKVNRPAQEPINAQDAVTCKNLTFAYEKGKYIIKSLNTSFKKGKTTCIVGSNASGKTTLLRLIAKEIKQQNGKIKCSARTCLLSQNAYYSFLHDELGKDIEETLKRFNLNKDDFDNIIKEYPFFEPIKKLWKQNPLDLSGGEAAKAAMLKTILTGAEILLLDEPTKGLDNNAKKEFLEIIKSLNNKGITVIMVTHDMDFCSKCADECKMMFRGQFVSEGQVYDFMNKNMFYTTPVCSITSELQIPALSVDEIEVEQ